MITIGIDDTDSIEGMCTTYLLAILIEKLKNYSLADLPRLVRLNPTIKYKTRGNAAVALKLNVSEEKEITKIWETTLATIEELAHFQDPKTNPGAVLLKGEPPAELRAFAMRAVRDVLTIKEARALIAKYEIKAKGYKNQRGLIGALAAASIELDPCTYELIAYREKARTGTKRFIDRASVLEADAATYPLTWDTVDLKNELIVFAPHSPDPVLFGIRGDDIKAIKRAFSMIKCEPVERSVLYRTNQGTDMHIIEAEIREARNWRSYKLTGIVSKEPRTIEGGHVIFSIAKGEYEIDCAAYQPTRQFRDIIRKLCTGDEISVYGSIKNWTLNLEKIEILKLAKVYEVHNPKCGICGKRMKSAGKAQGYRCKRCKTTAREAEKIKIKRDLALGLYEVPPSARRHLAMPLIRMRNLRKDIFPSR
ncbi:MAG: tRNA(Ile)(2)-agmatinylcytidine synthase [Methanocellales archaeon]